METICFYINIDFVSACIKLISCIRCDDDGADDDDDEVGDEKPIEWSVAAIERPNQWNCLRAYVSTLAHSRKYKKKKQREKTSQAGDTSARTSTAKDAGWLNAN